MRPHWQGFVQGLNKLGLDELTRRWDLGRRLIRDNGVTYNVYGDPQGMDRPWRLDPVPLVISAEEWAGLGAGIEQRAALLEAVLADLYGERSLVRRGIIPSALLHANPSFLRPCHGWSPAGGSWLHHYAADLVRGPDGQWRVLSDRTESPSGAGYALENRSIVSRMLPEFHRALQVERLGGFFDGLRRTLQGLAVRHRDDPRVVLLTPGPYNATYFEHAFLARRLGITLVEGEDLTVRDDNVYLKALTGLQQVDVILRRTSSTWCDPLELRGDSQLGVAGLLQSARRGNVAVVNAIGSGLLDGASLLGFMAALSRSLHDVPLLLPSVPSWWCGEPDALDYTLKNLGRLVLRPAFGRRDQPVIGAELNSTQLRDLRTEVTSRPWNWVGQEVKATSTLPVWSEGRLDSHHCVLRVFAVRTDKGWQAMPGGIARLSSERDLLASRLQTGGGGSKDVWIASPPQRLTVTAPRPQEAPVRLTRENRDLPSRVADNMFWLGRYLERCETNTRLLRSAVTRIEDSLAEGDAAQALITLRTMGALGLSLPAKWASEPREQVGERLIAHHMDSAGPGLAGSVERLLRVVVHLRDRLSNDTWRALHQLRDELAPSDRRGRDDEAVSRLNAMVLTLQAASGLVMENMTRGPQWLFLDCGRRLERAVSMVEMVSGALADVEGESAVSLDLLLEIWDSVMTYRSRYLATPRLAGVLDLLLCDEANPRSLGFQLATLEGHINRLAAMGEHSGFYKPEQKLMTVLCGTIRTTDVMVVARYDRDGGYHDALRLLDMLRSRLWELSEQIGRAYFTHAQWRLPTAPMEDTA